MEFREDIVDSLRPVIRLICISAILIDIVAAFVGYKFRKVADYVLYVHLIKFMVAYIIPAGSTTLSLNYIVNVHTVSFIAFGTNRVG